MEVFERELIERKAKAFDFLESMGATISVEFSESRQTFSPEGGWCIEDIIDNIFYGHSLLEACEKAMQLYKI